MEFFLYKYIIRWIYSCSHEDIGIIDMVFIDDDSCSNQTFVPGFYYKIRIDLVKNTNKTHITLQEVHRGLFNSLNMRKRQ